MASLPSLCRPSAGNQLDIPALDHCMSLPSTHFHLLTRFCQPFWNQGASGKRGRVASAAGLQERWARLEWHCGEKWSLHCYGALEFSPPPWKKIKLYSPSEHCSEIQLYSKNVNIYWIKKKNPLSHSLVLIKRWLSLFQLAFQPSVSESSPFLINYAFPFAAGQVLFQWTHQQRFCPAASATFAGSNSGSEWRLLSRWKSAP